METPIFLMENVCPAVSITSTTALTFLKCSVPGMKSTEAAPGLFHLLFTSVIHKEVLLCLMIATRLFPGVTVGCSVWSWLRNAGALPGALSSTSSSPRCSLPAESSKCDNRGTISSSSRPCSCKVYLQSKVQS